MMQAEQKETTTSDLRTFGLIMAGMITVFFVILIPWIWGDELFLYTWATDQVGADKQWWLMFVQRALIIAGAFAALALILPIALKPIYIVWMKIGMVVGWINSHLILSILFYVIIMPMGLVMRLFGKDPMARKLSDEEETYRVIREQPPREQLEKPY